MNTKEEGIALARQIYTLKVVLAPHWDRQGQARDSLAAAADFMVALAAEKGETAPAPQAEPQQPQQIQPGQPPRPQPQQTQQPQRSQPQPPHPQAPRMTPPPRT